MKKCFFLTVASLSIFAASNAMEHSPFQIDPDKEFVRACSCENEGTTTARIMQLLGYKDFFCTPLSQTGLARALEHAFFHHHPNVIKLLLKDSDFAEKIDSSMPFKSLIDQAYQNNRLNELVAFLSALSGYEEASDKLSHHAIRKAAESGSMIYLNALLTPEITKHVSKANLTDIENIIKSRNQISVEDRTIIMRRLEMLRSNQNEQIIS